MRAGIGATPDAAARALKGTRSRSSISEPARPVLVLGIDAGERERSRMATATLSAEIPFSAAQWLRTISGPRREPFALQIYAAGAESSFAF
jgi:hypothetical protein